MKMNKVNNKGKKEGIFVKKVDELLSILPDRSVEILKKRFGLLGKSKYTLERIGQEYNITRERVRQIIADSLRKISKNNKAVLVDIEKKIIFTINSNGGIISLKNALLKVSAGNDEDMRALEFLIQCSDEVKILEIKDFIQPSLIRSNFSLKKIEETEKIASDFLKENGKPVIFKSFVNELQKRFGKYENISREEIESYLNVFDGIRENSFGKWGLSIWPEISPKNTRDKIYLVLKENKKALHFSEIAKMIDEKGLSKKKAHPQTVHNELIKDKRFVLIGRGIYALAEWGYARGTVREVLSDILSDRGKLSKEDIFSEIMKIRKVKPATIMINLNNNKFFEKKDGLYCLKNS